VAVETDVITVYMQGGYGLSVNASSPLVTAGHYDLNSYATAFVSGMIESTDSATLFTDGVGRTNGIWYLFIEGYRDNLNSYIPLSVEVDNGASNDSIFLFLKNTQPAAPHSAARTLIIESAAPSLNGSMDMYLQNDSVGGSMTLWIKTPGMWENWLPTGRGMPLFINRPDESIAMSLFCKALDNGVNSYAPLHIYSAIEDTDAITLAIPNVASETLNTYATLVTTGVMISTDTETLYTTAHGVINGTAPLLVYQETGTPNAYVHLSVAGAYLHNDAITLVVPSVIDTTPQSEAPLYVFGWTL